MNILDCFLGLLAKTEGRDKFLRAVQYATLYSVSSGIEEPALKVNKQVRMVRKMLRFFRTLELSSKMREEFPLLRKNFTALPLFFKHLCSMLETLFNFLFFITDHRVLLGELGVIDSLNVQIYYSKSMKFYLLQNVFGAIHNILAIAVEALKLKKGEESTETVLKKIRKLGFDCIRCIFDCLVGLFYLNTGLNLSPSKVGILGVITSLMAICQSIGLA